MQDRPPYRDSQPRPPVAPPLSAVQAGVDPDWATPRPLDQDVPCLVCGYNLRGLRTDGRCPECGTPVGRSLHGNYFRFAGPAYVRTLARGMSLVLWGFLLPIIAVIVAIGLSYGHMGDWAGILVAVVGLGSAALQVLGAWLVTAPDPCRLDRDAQLNARRLYRAGAVMFALYVVLSIVSRHGMALRLGLRSADIILTAGTALTGLGAFVGFIASFVYFRQLALRIPDRPLAESTRKVMWGLIVTPLVGLVLTVGVALSGGGLGLLMLPCLVLLPLLIYGIWYLVLLVRYQRALTQQAERAEAVPRGPDASANQG